MEINQVSTAASSSVVSLSTQEPVDRQPEASTAVQNTTGPSSEAYQVELSAEARREQEASEAADEQAAEEARVEAELRAEEQNATYNAAGEIAG